MGCASSAALPFLTGRGTQGMGGSANGKMNGIKNANEAFVTDKIKETVDSSAVQGVIGGVIEAKDEIVEKVQGVGESVATNVTTMMEGVEDSIDSTMSQITQKIEEVEEKVKSEIKEVGEKISSVVGSENVEEKHDEIDQLLAELPDEEDLAAHSRTTAEELIEEATEEVTQDEMNE